MKKGDRVKINSTYTPISPRKVGEEGTVIDTNREGTSWKIEVALDNYTLPHYFQGAELDIIQQEKNHE